MMFRDPQPDVAEEVEQATAVDPGDELGVKEAAAYLNVSDMRIRTLLREGRLEGAHKVQVEGTSIQKWAIPVSGLDTYRETKGTFGGVRKGGKAFVVRISGPDQYEALKAFCEEQGMAAPEPRYKYDPEKQKEYREKRRQKKLEEAAAARE